MARWYEYDPAKPLYPQPEPESFFRLEWALFLGGCALLAFLVALGLFLFGRSGASLWVFAVMFTLMGLAWFVAPPNKPRT